jgi:hypothetical protein
VQNPLWESKPVKTVDRAYGFVALVSLSAAALAGDMLKPWASVIHGPHLAPGYHWTYESYEYESDCRKENAFQLARLRRTDETPAAHAVAGTTMTCVYQGSKNLYILKLRNLDNDAVLCIAKEKKFRDYRVVLIGAPMETDNYRCE